MRRLVVVLCAATVVGLGASARAAIVDTFDSISSNWTTDRYAPAVFQSTPFDGDNRLETGVSASAFNPYGSSWYNWQGKSLVLPTGTTESSVQLYVSADWKTSQRNASFWLNGWNGTNDQLAWPVIAFKSDGIGGAAWSYFNDDTGVWTDVALSSGFAYDAWHSFAIGYDNGTIKMYGDNQLLYTDAVVDPAMTSFKNVILQTKNYGTTYSGVYWDNLSDSGAVPEPATFIIWSLLGGLGISIAHWRRRKAA